MILNVVIFSLGIR
ncbi:hypothetical protein VCHENC02_2753A, partial [Vibrio harveyi]